MIYQIDLDKTLEELRQLLHDYSDLAIDLAARHNLEQLHKIHELKAKADHLKYLLAENQNTEAANNKNFLQHHAAALQHAVNHHFILERHLALALTDATEYEAETRELAEIYKALWRVYQILREQQEMKQHLQPQAQTKPELFGSRHDDK